MIEVLSVPWSSGIPGLKKFIRIDSYSGEILDDEVEVKCPGQTMIRRFALGTKKG